MCGICAKLRTDPGAGVGEAEIRRMTDVIAHRGPDGQGVYLGGPVGLGHRRLAIIDLCTGDQPMANEDETVWIVFNGEIYNFRELRAQLLAKGHVFKTSSDTEVIIHAYEEFGPDCVCHLRGMFAFAIWDARRRRLLVARDRIGIKPLYYCRTPEALYVASELKSILADPDVARDLNPAAVRQFLSFQYVPGAETLFKGIHKLLPGHYLLAEHGRVITRQYWDLQFTRQRWNLSYEQAVDELRQRLAQSVSDHMIADVPVGILLSGGVDSSAVLSFAVQNTGKKVKTFTVGFDGDQVVDERPYARLAAERFGTEHFETTITAEDFWSFLPSYVWHMEEPVCEPPAIALYYVTKLARGHVKVLLSGEGGDEAFGGYVNYQNMLRLDRVAAALGPLARAAGMLAEWTGRSLGESRLERYGYALGRPLEAHYFSRTSGPTAWLNRRCNGLFTGEFLRQTSAGGPREFIAALAQRVGQESLLNRMLYLDSKTWLPDDLLIKADKMTMANSVELRVPLLDHTVVEFAASLRPDFKVRGTQRKRVLKSAFAQALPPEVIGRKKAGFPVPYESWLCGECRAQMADLLLSSRALARGYFSRAGLEKLLKPSGRADGQRPKVLFSLVALELWHRKFADGPSEAKPIPWTLSSADRSRAGRRESGPKTVNKRFVGTARGQA